ncbi:RagB/SusD family nutrient uptake outer membrane protein [Pedobacter frigidisoli]|uniref:RagB/SusD family nutrient uptake outer membrane protein n=1 Tax=Pedobacter frigidisoli TaxID=2530455 RepID=UPI0029315454|nr:RagB/SusD family nutrient uptake outer membrane protein [Pedobacter frigidisoli]
MKIIKKCISVAVLIGIVSLSGCKKFLDVQITDRVTENELFNSTQGFQSAINGIYIEMASDQLYGRDMSAGLIDVMAQYYFAPTIFQPFKLFQYTDNAVNRPAFDAIWQKYYKVISNSNTIIDKCNTTSVLSATNKNIIKGEALAIRGFLHFDILRFWGPIYNSTSKTALIIPYSISSTPIVSPYRSSESITDSVIKDLTSSLELLKQSDPVTTQGRKNMSDLINGDFLSYRQYRLNYFAVKALLARVYQWRQDNTNARKYALEVIQEASSFFPFVTAAAATNTANTDRIFSSEILFGSYDNTRNAMYNNFLSPAASNRIYIQGDASGRANEMYDDKNDYRYLSYATQQVGNLSLFYNRKYEPQTTVINNQSVSSEFNNYIPLIRMSEMYYIAAETAPTVSEGLTYLNKVRLARSARDLTAADASALNLALRNEYRREFIGEGQLFFYYKRRSLTSVPDGSSATANITISVVNYVVPMVQSEVNLRN